MQNFQQPVGLNKRWVIDLTKSSLEAPHKEKVPSGDWGQHDGLLEDPSLNRPVRSLLAGVIPRVGIICFQGTEISGGEVCPYLYL